MVSLPNPESVRQVATEFACAWSARVPIRQAALAQIGAILMVLTLVVLAPATPMAGHYVMTLALLQGVIAAGLGRRMGMDSWWFPINLLFVPGLLWTLTLNIPSVYPFGVFCILASLYWGVSGTRVPLFLSSRAVTLAVAELLPRERSFTFLDMGCGFGGVLEQLARERPAGCYHGIESAPLPFLLSRFRAAFGARSCSISWGDFRDLDLSRYDVVYAYLSPAAMNDVWRKASHEMRPGSLLISNCFTIPGVPPTVMIATKTHGDPNLLLWRM